MKWRWRVGSNFPEYPTPPKGDGRSTTLDDYLTDTPAMRVERPEAPRRAPVAEPFDPTAFDTAAVSASYGHAPAIRAAHPELGETSERLLVLLDRLGDDYGPAGVARVAACLADRDLAQPGDERARKLAAILSDLDRCEHGRHEGDDCNGCGGPSTGNPLTPWVDGHYYTPSADGTTKGHVREVTARQIGYTMSGRPIVVPSGHATTDPGAWTPPMPGSMADVFVNRWGGTLEADTKDVAH